MAQNITRRYEGHKAWTNIQEVLDLSLCSNRAKLLFALLGSSNSHWFYHSLINLQLHVVVTLIAKLKYLLVLPWQAQSKKKDVPWLTRGVGFTTQL